jgi:type 1 glutamine amidotransferase
LLSLVQTGKRGAEAREMGDDATRFRSVLATYTPTYTAYLRTVTSSAMLMGYCVWAVERAGGGRGFGFTGGHYHDNWGNDAFRKVVLNALLWVAKVDVPTGGVESEVTPDDLDANLDPKR